MLAQPFTRRILSRPLAPLFSKPLAPYSQPRSQPLLHLPNRTSLFTTSTTPPLPGPKPSLSTRLKSLSREYGYSALAVYFGLSALDFPFCFLAIRTIGTETIVEYEEAATSAVKRAYLATGLPKLWTEKSEGGLKEITEETVDKQGDEKDNANIWTQLALAYAIHKSLIFIRVPLTAAITPKVVNVLKGWGWNIGRKGKLNIAAMKKPITPKEPK